MNPTHTARPSVRRRVAKALAATTVALAAFAAVQGTAHAAISGADLVTGSVPGGAFVAGQLRPDASVIIWRSGAPYALLDVRIVDTARDGRDAVVTCSGRFGAGAAWHTLASARTNGYGTTASIFTNAYSNPGLAPSHIKCTLTVGNNSVTDTNTRGGR